MIPRKAHHEVPLDELLLVLKTGLNGVVGGTLNLVVVVVQSDNVDTSESGHLASGSSNSTSDVKNGHTLLQSHHVGEEVLVTGDSLVESLTGVETTEVERLSPSVLVEVGSEVVVVTGEGSVTLDTLLYRVLDGVLSQ
jgi:hypothetical protein